MNKNFTLFLLLTLLCSQLLTAQTKSPKRGVAYGGNSAADLKAFSPGLTWWYNWSPTPEAATVPVYQQDNMDFVPMVWNGSFTTSQVVSQIPASGCQYLLAFNEPNFTAQANLTPSAAAALWPSIQSIAQQKGLKIVSPAVNYCGGCVSEGGVTFSDPVAWLDAFFADCKNCQVDYIAVHWYACDVLALQNYIYRFKKYGKPIWLTEFSCGDQDHSTITLATQQNYMHDAVAYLENEPAIFRYAWFSGRNNEIPYINLLGNSGELTTLGQYYVGLPGANNLVVQAETFNNMSGVQTELTKDTDGGIDVGYNDPGDWMSYPGTYIPTTGYYLVQYRVSSSGGGGKFTIDTAGNVLGTMNVASTGDWQNWTTISDTIYLAQGTHSFRISTIKAGYNLNWFSFTLINPESSGTLPGGGTTSPGDGAGNTAKSDLYPNPTTNQLTFSSKYDLSGGLIRIYDMAGRLMSELRPTSNTIDVSRLTPGVYNLVLLKNGTKTTRQFIKE
jgi:hypothetical protein